MATTFTALHSPTRSATFTVQEMNDIVRHAIRVDAVRPEHVSQGTGDRIPLWKLMPQMEATITPGEIERSITPATLIGAPQAYIRLAEHLEAAALLGGCAVTPGRRDSGVERRTA